MQNNIAEMFEKNSKNRNSFEFFNNQLTRGL
jgi:hypothetical protein